MTARGSSPTHDQAGSPPVGPLQALREKAWHATYCKASDHQPGVCTCGLSAALESVEEQLAALQRALGLAIKAGGDERLRSERPAVTPEMETLQLKLTGVLHAVGEMLVDEKHLRWHVTRLRSALENWGHHHNWCNVRKSPPEACNCGLAAELSVSSTEGKHGQ